MGLGEQTICNLSDKWCSKSPLIVYVLKMIFAILFDIVDLFVGIFFGIQGIATPTDVGGTIYDGIGVPIAVFLFGYEGLLYVGELFAGSYLNIADGFIPTMTIIGLVHGYKNKPWEQKPELESSIITMKATT